jgi:cyanophycinase
MNVASIQTLMAIGGAINLEKPLVLREFYMRAGGPQADIVILPTASSRPDAGQEFIEVLESLGLEKPVRILPIWERNDTTHPGHLAAIRRATGIFFTGGNQVRLSVTYGGTPLEAELHAAFQRGAVIAGTSAGAAILSTVMLAFGKEGSIPRQGIAQFIPGLGFTNQVIFDQHFRQRNRLGRLLFAVANNPGLLGVGVDENTVAIIEASTLAVFGQNAVTIVDGSELQATDVAEITGAGLVAISGVRFHILTHGCTYDLCTRRAYIPKKLSVVE